MKIAGSRCLQARTWAFSRNPTIMALWSQTPILKNYEKFLLLKLPNPWCFVWQLLQTKTSSIDQEFKKLWYREELSSRNCHAQKGHQVLSERLGEAEVWQLMETRGNFLFKMTTLQNQYLKNLCGTDKMCLKQFWMRDKGFKPWTNTGLFSKNSGSIVDLESGSKILHVLYIKLWSLMTKFFF